MNDDRRKVLQDAIGTLNKAKDEIEQAEADERDAFRERRHDARSDRRDRQPHRTPGGTVPIVKNLTVKYRVAPRSGHPAFPIDMLRYDAAFPAREADSAKINGTIHYAYTEAPTEIELIATANGCPNAARWHSFGWHVTHVWNGIDWEPYQEGHRNHRVTK